jgi:HEPN domain-containing protein
MDKLKRKMAEQWIQQGQRQKDTAELHLKFCRYPEAVQSAQQCCELCVKAIFSFLDIGYPREHALQREDLSRIAGELRERNVLERLAEMHRALALPRLLFLVNFWAQFYLVAKYGIQDGYLASAQELLKDNEAKVAIEHASECWLAAIWFVGLSDDQLAALSGRPT